jgi:pSer/pThr/pTyr-binding forkhead associated (FHA) protein
MSVALMLGAVVLLLLLAGVAIYALGGNGSESETWERSSKPTGASGASASPAAASNRKYNWLIGQTGDVEGKSFHVGKRTATIGRGIGNFIQTGDENSSRVHAQFKGAASGLKIKDMGSSNGTSVNGEELEADEFRRLEDGDRIEIGDTVLVYRREGDFQDAALTGSKNVQASQQKQTMAFGAVGGAGDLTAQVKVAVERADGDYEKAAQEVGLDPELVKRIVESQET